jgi:hypothetical protein
MSFHNNITHKAVRFFSLPNDSGIVPAKLFEERSLHIHFKRSLAMHRQSTLK